MGRFVGRSNELRLLAQAAESPRSAFIPIYGRRRVVKSELILRFMKDHPGVYYLGKQSPQGLQVRDGRECKWGAVRSPVALEDELARKARLYRNSRGATLNKRYFVRNKPASRADADAWYSLEDLYALP